MQLLFHHFRVGNIGASDVAVSKLKDPRISIMEAIKLQVDMRFYLMDELRNPNLPASEVSAIKSLCATPHPFRKYLTWP